MVTGTNKNSNIPTRAWDSKIIQMLYPRAKAIDQNPALCPAFPLPDAGLTLIGALLNNLARFLVQRYFKVDANVLIDSSFTLFRMQ